MCHQLIEFACWEATPFCCYLSTGERSRVRHWASELRELNGTNGVDLLDDIPFDALGAGRGSERAIVAPELQILAHHVKKIADVNLSCRILYGSKERSDEGIISVPAFFDVEEKSNHRLWTCVCWEYVDKVQLEVHEFSINAVLRRGVEV